MEQVEIFQALPWSPLNKADLGTKGDHHSRLWHGQCALKKIKTHVEFIPHGF
jgi:hypothetical protein